MTQPAIDQQRLEDAARSVGAKLQAFHDGLSPDEQAMLGAVLVHGVGELGDPSDDTVGYTPMAGLKLMGEMLSNVSKTRSEISMTFARNCRA